MNKLLLALLLVSAGCDSADDRIEIAEPAAESFSFAFVPDGDAAAVGPISGTARYEYTQAVATPDANTRLATATLLGSPTVTLTVYSTAGTTDFPPPGRYEFAQASTQPILVQLTMGGRVYSPYRGAVTIEQASATGLRVRVDAEMTTGGCAFLPPTVCSGPALTGRLLANVRAGADG